VSRTGGDGIGLAFEIQHEGGAGITEQVRNDRPDALAGAGRGAGKQMPILTEPTIGPMRRIAQDAQHKTVGGRGRR
jgi:hypothetical protein